MLGGLGVEMHRLVQCCRCRHERKSAPLPIDLVLMLSYVQLQYNC